MPDVPSVDAKEHEEQASSAQYREWEEEQKKIKPSELTDWELARLEREAEFDVRIQRMKEELAVSLEMPEKHGYEAEILHPAIQNLPHDIIYDGMDDELPDVEISQ